MPDSAAAKQQRYRARRAKGVAVYRVRADAVEIECRLIEMRLLQPQDTDDRRKVEAAIEQALQMLTRYA